MKVEFEFALTVMDKYLEALNHWLFPSLVACAFFAIVWNAVKKALAVLVLFHCMFQMKR